MASPTSLPLTTGFRDQLGVSIAGKLSGVYSSAFLNSYLKILGKADGFLRDSRSHLRNEATASRSLYRWRPASLWLLNGTWENTLGR